jgi:ABC-type transporter Mla maintaining outer membrane lipid asymmetry ATPase subunit MlaF
MSPLTTSPALAVRGLTKSFGERVVLDGFDLDVHAGEVVSGDITDSPRSGAAPQRG